MSASSDEDDNCCCTSTVDKTAHEYAGSTTIHGIAYVFEEGRQAYFLSQPCLSLFFKLELMDIKLHRNKE